MKIDEIHWKDVTVVRNDVSEKKGKATDSRDSAASSTNDKVSISYLINQLNQSVASSKEERVRSDRVAALKALMESGNYNVSGKQVAEKMLSIANV